MTFKQAIENIKHGPLSNEKKLIAIQAVKDLQIASRPFRDKEPDED